MDSNVNVVGNGNNGISKYHSYSAKYKHSLVLSSNNEGGSGNNGIQSQKELMSTFKYKTVKTPRVKVEPTIEHLFPSQATTTPDNRVKVSKSKSKLQIPQKQQSQQPLIQPQPINTIESMSNMIPFSPYQILNSFVENLPQVDIDTNTITSGVDTKNKKRVKSQLMMDSLTERYLSD